MPDSDPLISVVIPTRDRPDLLRRTLDRLAPGAQTLPAGRYEVIVSDDARPASAAAALSADYPWVTFVAGPARGPAANRNAGARAAMGGWLAFVDDDCHPDPGWLQAFSAAAASPDAPDILEGRTTCRDGVRSPLDHAPINDNGGLLWSCNLAVRRAAFAQLGGFDERFPHAHIEDVDFRERSRANGMRSAFVPDAVVDHPPRRLAFGARLAETHYGELLFARLHGVTISRSGMLSRLTGARWRAIRRHAGTDLLPALASWAAECVHVWRRWPAWEKAAAAAAKAPR